MMDDFEFPKRRFRFDAVRNLWRRVRSDGLLAIDWLCKCILCGQLTMTARYKEPYCRDCMCEHYKKLNYISGVAHNAVGRAVKDGLLPRIDANTKCVDCGKSAKVYDHRDYRKPLEVEPVCHSCNSLRGPAKDVEHLVLRFPKKFRKSA